ncbi:MAG TPA: DUF2157 domain-containing protein [Cyclobacteriaceae bacterium]|nr:DUF2157 domain-containing protein [Cyclobacteriaceae bacterium]
MTQQTPKELFAKGLITEAQYVKIDAIHSGKIISVFYELRSLLYLGVLLFTTGAGLLIYENIGELGHLLSIITLTLLTIACFWYTFTQAPAYTNEPVKGPTPYFDYIVLLGSLLFISVLGYLQFQFGILDENLGIITLVTALFYFFIAYRMDHAGVLSLGITALASFWSISVSPQKWYSGNFLETANLHVTAVVFGAALGGVAVILDKKSIKKHFTFTYLNFASLIFFSGAIGGLFVDESLYGIYLLVIAGGCAAAWYLARQMKSFLLLLYSFLAAYIGTTYFLGTIVTEEFFGFWFYYSIVSCGGFIFFIIKYKTFFSRGE